MDPRGDADVVHGDELVADIEGKTRRPEAIDEHLAVVNVGGEPKRGFVLGPKKEFVMRIVEARNLAEANIVNGAFSLAECGGIRPICRVYVCRSCSSLASGPVHPEDSKCRQ